MPCRCSRLALPPLLCPAAPAVPCCPCCAADEQDKGSLRPYHNNGQAHDRRPAGQAGPATLLLVPRHRCARPPALLLMARDGPAWPALAWPGLAARVLQGCSAVCCAHANLTALLPCLRPSPRLLSFLTSLLAFFPAAADDDMETMAQRYLSAAIKLGRPPNHCVVFAACPTSVTGRPRALLLPLPQPAVSRPAPALLLAVLHLSSRCLQRRTTARCPHTEPR